MRFTAILLLIVLLALIADNSTSAQPIVDIPKIAGADKPEVEKFLGQATSCETIKYGLKCYFTVGETEIVFIDGKADWITINQMQTTPYSPQALTALGLKNQKPTFSSDDVIRWEDIQGIREISIFPAGKKIFYVYIKMKTK